MGRTHDSEEKWPAHTAVVGDTASRGHRHTVRRRDAPVDEAGGSSASLSCVGLPAHQDMPRRLRGCQVAQPLASRHLRLLCHVERRCLAVVLHILR